jgi:hypothetical protein
MSFSTYSQTTLFFEETASILDQVSDIANHEGMPMALKIVSKFNKLLCDSA